MNFSDRLTQLIDNQYNGNKKKFSESTRIPYTSVVEYTKGVKKDPKLSLINKIQDSNINVNALWLLTGRGEMLVGEGKPVAGINKGGEGIPLISVEAMAGWGSGAVQVMEYDLKRYVIPEFTELKVDFMIPVRGSSMYPKYNSGDLVACRKLPSDTFFQWNKVYVLDTVQGAMIKRVKPSEKEDCINCISDNERYEPFELHLSEIYSLALVVGVIRLE